MEDAISKADGEETDGRWTAAEPRGNDGRCRLDEALADQPPLKLITPPIIFDILPTRCLSPRYWRLLVLPTDHRLTALQL
jgi:hypothetical protein